MAFKPVIAGFVNVPAAGVGTVTSVLVRHKGGTSSSYQPGANTDTARGTALLSALASLVDGDSLDIGGGTYNLSDARAVIPDGSISVHGAGIDVTKIVSSPDDASFNNVLKLGTGSVVSDLTVDTTANSTSIAAPVGFRTTGGEQTVATTFTLIRVKAVGNADSFRFAAASAGEAFNGTLIDCVARGFWDGCVTSGSGPPTLRIINPDFAIVNPGNGNSSHALSVGGTVIVEGGSLACSGSTADNIGFSLGSGGSATISGTKITTSGTGALDLVQTTGTLRIAGGSGSGTAGVFTSSGTITYAIPGAQSVDPNLTTLVVFPTAVTGLDATVLNVYDILTVPTGKTFVYMAAQWRLASLTGTYVSAPGFQIKESSTGNLFTNQSSASGTAMSTVGFLRYFAAPVSTNTPQTVTAGNKLQVVVATAAVVTAGTYTVDVFAEGFYY